MKLLQVWEDWSLDELIDACHEFGFTGMVVKALDGTDWMRKFDVSPDALGSVEDVAAQAFRVRSEGLYYFVWTVPHDSYNNAVEGALHGEAAQACDGLFIDAEPYSGFWGANQPAGDAAHFMASVRRVAPNAFVALQPDPRPARLAEIRFDEWRPAIDALAGQYYWSDFGTSSTAELTAALALGQTTGLPILPTLPGNADLASFDMRLVEQLPGFVVWRWGTIPQATLQALGQISVQGLVNSRIATR